MKKKIVLAISIYFLLLIGLRVYQRYIQLTSKKVILFVWDGTQRNHLVDSYRNKKIPILNNLVDKGGMLRTDVEIKTKTCSSGSGDGYVPQTGPGNSAIITGYGYPEQANQSNDTPDKISSGYTFFERLKTAYPDAKTGVISTKLKPFWPYPPLSNAEPNIDFKWTEDTTSSAAAQQAIKFIDKYKHHKFFLLVHFKHPDSEGHAYGENSKAYQTELWVDGLQTEKIIKELETQGIRDKTKILITTDHGFTEGGTDHLQCLKDNLDIWIVSDRSFLISKTTDAFQTSIVPTLFDIFRMDKNVSPPFRSESLFNREEFSLRLFKILK